MPKPKQMHPVRSAVEFRGEGATRFFYGTRPTDDLGLLLANKRSRDVRRVYMQYNVHLEMSRKMDTGVRVNRMLASALGVDAVSSSEAAHPRMHLKHAPTDATLVVFGKELDSTEEEARGLVLFAIVVL
jgi:hypothetical protein